MSNLAQEWHFFCNCLKIAMWRLLDYFLFCDTWKEHQRSDLDRCKHCSAIKNESEPYRVDLLHKNKSVLFSPRLKYRDIYCILQLTNAKWPLIDLPIILIHYACGGLDVSDETQILSIIYEVNFWSIMLYSSVFYVSEFISIHYWTHWWKRLRIHSEIAGMTKSIKTRNPL